MTLQERISNDMKEAMKNREADRLSAIRMIRSEILNLEKEGKGTLDDAMIVQLLNKMARQRLDSIEQYRAGNREDLAAKEEAELAIIKAYLPETVSREEIDSAVEAAIQETGASTPKEMGRVMGVVLKKLKETGKGVDGGEVSAAVKARLGA